ncbi:hypothetical protein COL32_07390 [Bacillus pseudomycoides]|uniref:hypothetical protein n=2 Tax=Bacillus pseudomycoides TaxID=64104 RepID=UPI000BF97254|nr:hypothetical protein [Bacillus pseudomycoides]PFW94298.1 hypothetical protein COL29_11670 [Bacillus pseudomycoides]PFX46329.1 hypothetical protein COL32_07390 [Bacillus pseudomycoides]
MKIVEMAELVQLSLLPFQNLKWEGEMKEDFVTYKERCVFGILTENKNLNVFMKRNYYFDDILKTSKYIQDVVHLLRRECVLLVIQKF